MRTTHWITTKTWQLHCSGHGYYVIRFWSSSVSFWPIFFTNFGCVFFQCQTLFWSYLRNGWLDWCETKRKCIGGTMGTVCDLDLWPHSDLDLVCFKVKFRNSSISWVVGLVDVKWKRGELIWYWADCMNLPFDDTHELDLRVEISRSESDIHAALSQD